MALFGSLVNRNEFGCLGQEPLSSCSCLGPILVQFWPKLTFLDSLWQKFQNFMKISYSVLQAMWKSHLVWLFRPLLMCLVIRSKFGPFRPKISQIRGGTPTFYWPPRLYLPIGIQNCPCFCWRISSHFWLGSKSQ